MELNFKIGDEVFKIGDEVIYDDGVTAWGIGIITKIDMDYAWPISVFFKDIDEYRAFTSEGSCPLGGKAVLKHKQ